MPQVRFGWLAPSELPPCTATRSCFGPISIDRGFYKALLANVRQNGFRNPVLLDNGGGKYTPTYGGSRCWVAHQLDIPVPAFINDWCGQFTHLELITSEAQAMDKFKNPPRRFRLGPPIFFFTCQ